MHGADGPEIARAQNRRRVPKISMQSASEVRDVIQGCVAEIKAGRLDSQQGYAIARLCSVALEAIQLVPQEHQPHQERDSQPEAKPTAPAAPPRPHWAPPDLDVPEAISG